MIRNKEGLRSVLNKMGKMGVQREWNVLEKYVWVVAWCEVVMFLVAFIVGCVGLNMYYMILGGMMMVWRWSVCKRVIKYMGEKKTEMPRRGETVGEIWRNGEKYGGISRYLKTYVRMMVIMLLIWMRSIMLRRDLGGRGVSGCGRSSCSREVNNETVVYNPAGFFTSDVEGREVYSESETYAFCDWGRECRWADSNGGEMVTYDDEGEVWEGIDGKATSNVGDYEDKGKGLAEGLYEGVTKGDNVVFCPGVNSVTGVGKRICPVCASFQIKRFGDSKVGLSQCNLGNMDLVEIHDYHVLCHVCPGKSRFLGFGFEYEESKKKMYIEGMYWMNMVIIVYPMLVLTGLIFIARKDGKDVDLMEFK